MTTDADMDTGTTTTTTTTMGAITLMLVTQTSMCLIYLAMTIPAIMCTRIQIRIPSIPLITAMLLRHIHNRIHIHSPITITNDKRVNLLRIPTRMCMSIPTSHILIPTLHLLKRSKPSTVRSLPPSGNENLILVAHHFKLRSKVTSHFQHAQFKFHFRCRLRWIHHSLLIIPTHSSMTTTLCTTTMMLVMDTPLTPVGTTTITKVTVTTCVGYSCTLWRYVSFRFPTTRLNDQ